MVFFFQVEYLRSLLNEVTWDTSWCRNINLFKSSDLSITASIICSSLCNPVFFLLAIGDL